MVYVAKMVRRRRRRRRNRRVADATWHFMLAWHRTIRRYGWKRCVRAGVTSCILDVSMMHGCRHGARAHFGADAEEVEVSSAVGHTLNLRPLPPHTLPDSGIRHNQAHCTQTICPEMPDNRISRTPHFRYRTLYRRHQPPPSPLCTGMNTQTGQYFPLQQYLLPPHATTGHQPPLAATTTKPNAFIEIVSTRTEIERFSGIAFLLRSRVRALCISFCD